MEFKFTDNRNWKYIFLIEEDYLESIEISVRDEKDSLVHRDSIALFEKGYYFVFVWKSYHLNKDYPLVSKEAREFCQKSVRRFMKMKMFW